MILPTFFTAIGVFLAPTLATPVGPQRLQAPFLRTEDEGGEERRRARFRTQELQPILQAAPDVGNPPEKCPDVSPER